MSWLPIGAGHWPWRRDGLSAETPHSQIPVSLRLTGVALRTVFIVSLLIVTVHVAMPQSETIWTAYETPGDLIRMILGFVVCVWLAIQLFVVPKDAQAYRIWIYLGLAAIPFAAICIFGIW